MTRATGDLKRLELWKIKQSIGTQLIILRRPIRQDHRCINLFPNRNTDGKLAITRVELRPKITWGGDRRPSAEELKKMHHSAHENCFIANSVKTDVTMTKPQRGRLTLKRGPDHPA